MVRDNAPCVKSMASGMFNGCVFFTRPRVKKVFTVGIVQMKLEHKTLLIAENEDQI